MNFTFEILMQGKASTSVEVFLSPKELYDYDIVIKGIFDDIFEYSPDVLGDLGVLSSMKDFPVHTRDELFEMFTDRIVRVSSTEAEHEALVGITLDDAVDAFNLQEDIGYDALFSWLDACGTPSSFTRGEYNSCLVGRFRDVSEFGEDRIESLGVFTNFPSLESYFNYNDYGDDILSEYQFSDDYGDLFVFEC